MTLNEQCLLTESFIRFVKSLCIEGTDVDGEWVLHLDVSDEQDVRHRLMHWLDQEELHTHTIIKASREDKAVPQPTHCS